MLYQTFVHIMYGKAICLRGVNGGVNIVATGTIQLSNSASVVFEGRWFGRKRSEGEGGSWEN